MILSPSRTDMIGATAFVAVLALIAFGNVVAFASYLGVLEW